MKPRRHALRPALRALGAFALALPACAPGPVADAGAAAPEPARFTVPAGDYAGAFERAKANLRQSGFILARVDAHAGVITTAPRVSAGLATPWAGAEATFSDSVGAAMNVERRVVVIRFSPQPDAAPDNDWRAGPVVGAVRALVYRVRAPGRRIETASIRLTSYSSDADLASRGLEPDYTALEREDPALAQRVASSLGPAPGLPTQ